MKVKGKAQAVKDWVQSFTDETLKLNASVSHAGEVALNIVSNDVAVETYIDGSAKRAYTFALSMMQAWSAGTDDLNEKAQAQAEMWYDWVTAKNDAADFPDFGKDAQIEKVEPLVNTPTIAAIYSNEQIAKYQFSARITYEQ